MKVMFRLVVWLIMIVGGIWGGLLLDRVLFPLIYKSVTAHVIGFIIGLLLLNVVMAISRNTGRTLAKLGREGELPRMETNRLVTEGVYKMMRHPMHLGLLLFPFAFAFMAGSPSFVMIIAPIEALFMIVMIKLVEEPEALRKFGDEYRVYMKTTPWFCIKPSCLKMLLKKVEKNDTKT